MVEPGKRRMRTPRFVVGAAVCLAMCVTPIATAATVVRDPAEVRGPLDVRRVELRGQNAGRWLIKTYGGWTRKRIQDRGFFLVFLDTFGTRRFDFYALVRSNGEKLKGSLWRDRKKKPDYRVRFLRTSHPGRKIAGVRVGLAGLRKRQSYYRWQVETLWNGKACPGVCFDRAPSVRALRRPLP
jgi:hypothetical protein